MPDPKKSAPKAIVAEPVDGQIPYDTSPPKAATPEDELRIAAATAEMIEALGGTPEVDDRTLEEEKKLLNDALGKKTPINTLPAALGAAAFLKTYGQQLAMNVVQVRAALTNKLLELADCGDPKYELQAINLLGKHSDIGLFTTRSEVTVNYSSPESLELAIKERVKRIMHSNMTSEVPLSSRSLLEEMGIEDAEYSEVDPEAEMDEVEALIRNKAPTVEEKPSLDGDKIAKKEANNSQNGGNPKKVVH